MSGVGLDWFEYRQAVELWRSRPGFYALVAAAMQRADTVNLLRLQAAFPQVWADLQARYDAPGGVLDSDAPGIRAHALESES